MVKTSGNSSVQVTVKKTVHLLKEKVEKVARQPFITQHAPLANLSVEEAAKLHIRANAGDTAAQKIVRELRFARQLERRISQTASRGGLTMEEARDLHTRAHGGDEAAKNRIQEIRRAHRDVSATGSAN